MDYLTCLETRVLTGLSAVWDGADYHGTTTVHKRPPCSFPRMGSEPRPVSSFGTVRQQCMLTLESQVLFLCNRLASRPEAVEKILNGFFPRIGVGGE